VAVATVTDGGSSRLRIAVVAPPFYEIPPPSYGGTERVCYLLVEGFVRRGHDVTLIAAGRNHTTGRFIATFPEAQPEGSETDTEVELLHAARAAVALSELDLDVVHDHTRAGPLTAASRATPTVATVHAAVTGPESRAEALAVLGRWVRLVAISDAHRAGAPHLNWVATVHNGMPVEEFPFSAEKQEYLLYLGRLSPQKGVHLAIDAAREAGRPLIVAGGWTIPSERAYFDQEIRPRIGQGVEWVGEVGAAERLRLLAGASCLLYPIRWEEPFGLAVVEAMACGTPVVALRAGSMPELIVDHETGILCDEPSKLAAAIQAAIRLDPGACRAHVAQHFGVERMIDGYESVYRTVIRER
jgi:glycosyltransferase involved in cell wall biosynthesis